LFIFTKDPYEIIDGVKFNSSINRSNYLHVSQTIHAFTNFIPLIIEIYKCTLLWRGTFDMISSLLEVTIIFPIEKNYH